MTRKELERLDREFGRAVAALVELQRRLPWLRARDAHRPTLDGWPSGGMRSGGRTYDPRPTEATALRRADGFRLPDELGEHLDAIDEHVLAPVLSAGAKARHELGAIDKLSLQEAPGAPLVCCNPACEHVITRVGENDRPRRGRCRRCFNYLNQHDRDWTPRVEQVS
jgi:hypothetical protein